MIKSSIPCDAKRNVNAHSNMVAKALGMPLDARRPSDHARPNSTERQTATQKFFFHFWYFEELMVLSAGLFVRAVMVKMNMTQLKI